MGEPIDRYFFLRHITQVFTLVWERKSFLLALALNDHNIFFFFLSPIVKNKLEIKFLLWLVFSLFVFELVARSQARLINFITIQSSSKIIKENDDRLCFIDIISTLYSLS
jgi:hypothetical protein